MQRLFVFVVFVCLIISGCSASEEIDLSEQRLYGYQPNTSLEKDRMSPIIEEQKLGENILLRYEDGVNFIVSPDQSILSIEAPSEMDPADSGNGIKRGDSMNKVTERMGKSYSTRMEQGAKIYTYKDSKHNLTLEYWSTDHKVDSIRFKAEIK